MKWDFEEITQSVIKKHGPQQAEVLGPLLNSVGRKFQIARYHSVESKRIIDQYFGSNSFENYDKAIGFIFDRGNGDEEITRFYKDAFISEANVVAYSQAIHSAYDIIGQIIIVAFNIGHLFQPGQNIYLHTVKKKLISRGLANNVVARIEAALNCEPYQYLRAFVNTNKHLCLLSIAHTVEMDAEEETPFGIQINSFRYEEELFPKKWATNFVTEDFRTLSEGIVSVGNSVNDFLR